jgi:hypothetical protein
MYTRQTAIKEYSEELEFAKQWKEEGTENVPACTAGEELAAGRPFVPIDEYIKMWEDGLAIANDPNSTEEQIEALNY